jgi:nucleotide-binding universal stress UspA family protein
MKILLAVDGSPYSEMATKTLKALQLPSHTEVTVMTVVPEHTFLGKITLTMLIGGDAARELAHKAQEQKAMELLKGPVETLQASGVKVESLVRWGKPAEEIIKRAHEIGAHLVVIGASGTGDSPRFPLGSVAHKVMKYADTSVLLVREATTAMRRVLIATDGSKYSDEVAQFLLDLPLPHKSQVFVVTALQSHIAALMKTPTMDLETNQQLLAELRAAEEKVARSLMANSKKRFLEKGYEVSSMVLRGEPAQEILMVAETLTPDLIALGAKGLTGTEAFLLGSVSQRVARFARYSVLIGRAQGRPKLDNVGSPSGCPGQTV